MIVFCGGVVSEVFPLYISRETLLARSRDEVPRYVRGNSDCDEPIPEWFYVTVGVDSEDLPLNFSCETLLQNKAVRW